MIRRPAVKLRHDRACTLRDRDTNPHYEPIGVWVQGPGPGLDIVTEYLPGNEEFAEDADWVINRLVENDIRSLPEDFLEYHQATMSPEGCRGRSWRQHALRRQSAQPHTCLATLP